MDAISSTGKRLSARHWVFQIAPPTLLLLTLSSTQRGPALVYLAGIFIIAALVSFISIAFKLIAFKRRKQFLLRPILTIFFLGVALAIVNWSYGVALRQATDAAELLHQQCKSDLVCPTEPDGWSTDGQRISRRDLGAWYKYPASYSYNPESFDIRVYKGPDIGDMIAGGVDVPFSVSRYTEN